jgi:threonyl-tRNA synthetase
MKDHREIGQQLDLFMFSPVSPGCPIWLPHGNTVYSLLSEKIRQYNLKNGYVEVRTPLLYKPELFKTSGHWDHYKENMFIIGDEEYALKPMNCPAHMTIFAAKQWSYRDLPYRIHDQGVLHRNEVSGAIGGLTRCRSFCQDDAHCFIPSEPDAIAKEAFELVGMVGDVYRAFGMSLRAVLSTRPEKFMGVAKAWNQAEDALKSVLNMGSLSFEIDEGKGAFYGPKIDFMVKDSLDREWQTATIQLDFQLPQRFNLKYADSNDVDQMPIVIHRAFYGSFERFIAILLEHYQGELPFWLAPVQMVLLPIADRHHQAVEYYHEYLSRHFRVEIDRSNNTLPHKIALATEQKIPYMLVVGDKELANGGMNIRDRRGKQEMLDMYGLQQKLAVEGNFSFERMS